MLYSSSFERQSFEQATLSVPRGQQLKGNLRSRGWSVFEDRTPVLGRAIAKIVLRNASIIINATNMLLDISTGALDIQSRATVMTKALRLRLSMIHRHSMEICASRHKAAKV